MKTAIAVFGVGLLLLCSVLEIQGVSPMSCPEPSKCSIRVNMGCVIFLGFILC